MPIANYFQYHPGSITRLVTILAANGIKSREDLLERYDVGTNSYEAIKGIGPVLSDLLVWLRGRTIEDIERLTGLPAFNTIPQPTAAQEWG